MPASPCPCLGCDTRHQDSATKELRSGRRAQVTPHSGTAAPHLPPAEEELVPAELHVNVGQHYL